MPKELYLDEMENKKEEKAKKYSNTMLWIEKTLYGSKLVIGVPEDVDLTKYNSFRTQYTKKNIKDSYSGIIKYEDLLKKIKGK